MRAGHCTVLERVVTISVYTGLTVCGPYSKPFPETKSFNSYRDSGQKRQVPWEADIEAKIWMQEVGVLSETPVKGDRHLQTEGGELLQRGLSRFWGGPLGPGWPCRVVPIKTRELNYFTSHQQVPGCRLPLGRGHTFEQSSFLWQRAMPGEELNCELLATNTQP